VRAGKGAGRGEKFVLLQYDTVLERTNGTEKSDERPETISMPEVGGVLSLLLRREREGFYDVLDVLVCDVAFDEGRRTRRSKFRTKEEGRRRKRLSARPVWCG